MTTIITPLTLEQKNILLHLVSTRHAARILMRSRSHNLKTIEILESAHRDAIEFGDTEGEAVSKIRLDRAQERQLELRFKIIEVGKSFIAASGQYDQLPREVWLRALSVNESEWDSPDMRKYGGSVRNVVAVLNLENSATSDDSVANHPLHWCCTMGMMHTSQTDPRLGRALHDACNEVFGGAFGEYQEPTMLERMGVK